MLSNPHAARVLRFCGLFCGLFLMFEKWGLSPKIPLKNTLKWGEVITEKVRNVRTCIYRFFEYFFQFSLKFGTSRTFLIKIRKKFGHAPNFFCYNWVVNFGMTRSLHNII